MIARSTMHLQTRVSYAVLDCLLLGALRATVGKASGLWVDEVRLDLEEEDAGSASFRLEVTVSKWARLIQAVVVVRGHFVIDDQFQVRVFGLSASSRGLRGVIGSVAGLFIDVGDRVQGQLSAWEGRSFPLGPLFPGRELRDVKVHCRTEELEVTALFAS
jgi:hypothetical protein